MSALPALVPDPLPTRQDPDGVIRVGGTRVTLDVLVEAFDDGATAEEIVHQYPVLHLADIYAVLGHVLHHRPEVDAYLEGRREQHAMVRAANEQRSDPHGIRERLLARRREI